MFVSVIHPDPQLTVVGKRNELAVHTVNTVTVAEFVDSGTQPRLHLFH